jgi:voltage-gated potassium channel Kch
MHTESSHFDHHIVCGFGRLGETLCRRLSQTEEPFVAVDIDRERLARARWQRGWSCVVGDAMQDDFDTRWNPACHNAVLFSRNGC